MSAARPAEAAPPAIAIIGLGRMGRAVEDLARGRGWPIRAMLGRGVAVTAERLAGANVAIEFTAPDAAAANVRACVAAGCPVVVGTTGWYDTLPAVQGDVERAGGAMLWAPNFSLGAAALTAAAAHAASALRAAGGFDAHIIETHHAGKRDAPSGTARMLAAALDAALDRAVPVSSVRVGHVPGTHEVVFDAPFEQLRLEHVVRDRRVFADGALTAAAWLVGVGVAGVRRGVFTIDDVLRGARVAGADGPAGAAHGGSR